MGLFLTCRRSLAGDQRPLILIGDGHSLFLKLLYLLVGAALLVGGGALAPARWVSCFPARFFTAYHFYYCTTANTATRAAKNLSRSRCLLLASSARF